MIASVFDPVDLTLGELDRGDSIRRDLRRERQSDRVDRGYVEFGVVQLFDDEIGIVERRRSLNIFDDFDAVPRQAVVPLHRFVQNAWKGSSVKDELVFAPAHWS